MQILRMFSNEKYKGTRNYLATQKKYEIMRTILYFGVSLSLFAAGWIATKSRLNLLTIVAVLGCLPASKSAVEMIMYLRFKGCTPENADRISEHTDGLEGLFDLVFTSYHSNYPVAHITVRGNTVCGFTQDSQFPEQEFYKHIAGILRADNFKEVSVKIFTDRKKYTERLEQLKELNGEDNITQGILSTLKSVSL